MELMIRHTGFAKIRQLDLKQQQQNILNIKVQNKNKNSAIICIKTFLSIYNVIIIKYKLRNQFQNHQQIVNFVFPTCYCYYTVETKQKLYIFFNKFTNSFYQAQSNVLNFEQSGFTPNKRFETCFLGLKNYSYQIKRVF